MKNPKTAWSKIWLRELSAKQLFEMHSHFVSNPPNVGIAIIRARRVSEEWQRRKRNNRYSGNPGSGHIADCGNLSEGEFR